MRTRCGHGFVAVFKYQSYTCKASNGESMAKVTYVLVQGENSAGESQVNFRVYISRELRLRVPSGIWIDRKRWGKKNDINVPNIPGEERNALLSKRAKLKELVDVIEHTIEATDDKSTVTREWLEKLIRRTIRSSSIRSRRSFTALRSILRPRSGNSWPRRTWGMTSSWRRSAISLSFSA